MSRRRILVILLALAATVVIILIVRNMMSAGDEGEAMTTNVAVHVDAVGRATLHRYVTAYGYVEPAPAGHAAAPAGALLATQVGGMLTGVDCVESQRVSRGTICFRLDSRMADVAVLKAQAAAAFADSAFQRQQALAATDGTSARAVQEARQRLDAARSDLAAAETARSYLQITAPLTGTLVHLNAKVGQFVDANTILAEVVDMDRLVVTAGVPTREAAGLQVGQPVFLGPDNAAAQGTLSIVGRDVDPATGTYRVQVSIPPDAGFAPGAFTDVRIVTETHADVLAVPEVSLVTRAGTSWVVVVEGDRAVRHPVTAGLREGGLVEVSGEGLEAGTTIVTDDAYSLPEETMIRIVRR